MKTRLLVLCAVVTMATGCSTVKGWFSKDGGSKKANQPTELVKLEAGLKINEVWSRSVGDGEDKLGYRLRPNTDGTRIYAVDAEGRVQAMNPATGKTLWESDLFKNKRSTREWLTFWRSRVKETGLTSSVGVSSALLAVGGRNGEVFALDPATGSQKWVVKTGAEVISAPYVGAERVVVHLNDGRVLGLDAADGARKWSYVRGLPSLSLRGTSPPVGAQGLVFVGTDDGRVVALSEQDGRTLWEQTVAEPEGRTELDRIADVDGEIQIGNEEIYINSYGNQMLVLGAANGRPLWAKDVGSAHGSALANEKVIVSDKNGTVWALDRSTGSVLWKQESLARRQLTGPVIHGGYAVVADLEGYVHWLKLEDGTIAGRDRVQSAIVRAVPLVTADGLLVAQTTEGKVAAYRLP
jgi:outer membrane protein assembly factor BamB